MSGSIGYWDENLYRDYLEDCIKMADDCDIDCQAKGSQLTTIGVLMGLVFGLISLNALFMFIGTWRYRWRVCSIYCTLFMCVFQLAILCVVATMLFTPYNAVCGRSMHTAVGKGEFPWYMGDDFYATASLWIISWFLMIGFCCCGLCSARKET